MKRINSNYIANYLPYAVANITGSDEYKEIVGKVKIYKWKTGSIIRVEINGLPNDSKNEFFGFHIHEGEKCIQEEGKEAFESAGAHLNTENDKHPNHIGDLPMIYSNAGYAYMEFFTNRFVPSQIISHTVIIHENKDDLITNPAGNSGKRIACGEIKRYI